MWVQLILLALSAVLSALLAPKPTQPKPPRLTDVDIPTAEEDRPIPVVFGTHWITGPNTVWYGDLRADPIVEEVEKK